VTDRDETWKQLRAAAGRGDWSQVRQRGLPLIEQVNLPESEWIRAAGALGEAYARLEFPRQAATAKLATGDAAGALALLGDHPGDAAIVRRAAGDLRGSAEQLLEANLPAQAAVAFEQAGDFPTARLLWERVLADANLRRDPYVQALVAFNHGRCCARLEDRGAARRSYVRAVGLLEEAADDFASRGERERAFDCYQVVLTLGREEGQFENVAEGFLNSVRILREDLLKYWAIQYVEEFLTECERRQEFHAAATLLREAAEYCRRQGLEYGPWYRARCAAAWRQAAEHSLSTGAPPELAENAILAAIDAWSAVGAFPRVREAYLRLAQLALADDRRTRYARIAARYDTAKDEMGTPEPFPEHLRRKITYPEVWHVDVIEWEQGGDAAALAGDLLADRRNPQTTRRYAAVCRLAALDSPPDDSPQLVKLAERLARLQVWSCLGPLEKLFATGAPPVRAAVLRAVQSLYFKRSYGLVRRGLEDPAEQVRKEALEAVKVLRFGHAFDPLVRIFREARDAVVRVAALRSIGSINAPEAAEHLLDVLRTDEPALREEAAGILADMSVQGLDDLLRRALSTDPTSPLLARVIRSRGHAPPL